MLVAFLPLYLNAQEQLDSVVNARVDSAINAKLQIMANNIKRDTVSDK